MTLRSRVIRLAHQNPELRPFLLGILSQGASHPGEDMANQIASGLEWAHMVDVPVDGAPVGSSHMAGHTYPPLNLRSHLLKALRETTVDGRVASDFPPEIRGSYPYLRTLGFSESDFRIALIIAQEFVKNLGEVSRRVIDEWKVDYKATTNIDGARRIVALMNDPVKGMASYRKALVAAEYGVASMAELEANLSKFQGKDFDDVKKWAANVTASMKLQNVTLVSLKRRIVIAFNALTKLVKANPLPAAPAPAPKAPPPVVDPKKAIITQVSEELRFMPKMSTGGRMRRLETHEYGWTLEPEWRERLDHYGNDGDGWDSDGWEMNYAGPLREEAQKWLDKTFGPNHLEADVGEKGHLNIQPVGEWSDILKK